MAVDFGTKLRSSGPEGASDRGILDNGCSGVEVDMTVSLQVDDEAGICVEIRQPVPSAGRSGDEESSLDVKHPDLDTPGRPGPSTRRRDVHGRIISEFITYNIHQRRVSGRQSLLSPHPGCLAAGWVVDRT